MIRYSAMPAKPQHPMPEPPFHEYLNDDGTVWTEFYRQEENYLLRFPDLADFNISADGTEVTAHPMTDCDANTVEHLYINQIVPLALSRQGRPAFHASVVTVPGGAVAFLGQSGAGKSTLAASFALDGAAFLTDDALLIEEVDGACKVLPSHASVRLWDDSVDALIGDDILRAGEISIHSDLLLHGSAANDSDRRRCGLTLRYCTADVRAGMDWNQKGVIVSGADPTGHWANRMSRNVDRLTGRAGSGVMATTAPATASKVTPSTPVLHPVGACPKPISTRPLRMVNAAPSSPTRRIRSRSSSGNDSPPAWL